MTGVQKDSSLGDSSGSDGSLSKHLSHQAEMNFSSQGVNLSFDNEVSERTESAVVGEGPSENDGEYRMPIGADLSKEMEIAAKYIQTSEIADVIEQDCDLDGALMLCENCQGPITKMKKFGNTGKQFCSKQCAETQNKNQDLSDGQIDDDGDKFDLSLQSTKQLQDSTQTESSISQMNSNPEKEMEIDDTERMANFPPDLDWKKYRDMLIEKAAPATCFGKLSKSVKGLKPGMKLEALDKNNPCNYCVATVIDVVGHRVRIRYDGFGNDESQDFWCNFQAEELFPIGWCAENSYPLQPPAGITSTLEDWKTFLTKTLTGALAAPMDLFKENENRLQLKVHSFQSGMRVECIHPKRPSIICPGTVSKSLGAYSYQITTEPLPHLPAHTFYGHSESTGIFSFGWTMKNGIDLALPAYVDGSIGLSKDKYIATCKARSAPPLELHKKTINSFKIDQKLEAVDLEEPSVIRVATIFNIVGRVLHLLFDGQRKFQYVDCESEDIYPIEWCMKTGHPLSTPYGLDPSTQVSLERNIVVFPQVKNVISSLCADLLTKCNRTRGRQSHREPLNDSTIDSPSFCKRPRKCSSSCSRSSCYENEIPSLTCRGCDVSGINRSTPCSDLDSDSEPETRHSRCRSEYQNTCRKGYRTTRRHTCSQGSHSCERKFNKTKRSRQTCCSSLTCCNSLARSSENFMELADSSDENEGRQCFAAREEPSYTRPKAKKRSWVDDGAKEVVSNVIEVVNKVKDDLTSAVEAINLSIQHLTRKLSYIEEKLTESTRVNQPCNNEFAKFRNNNKKVRRVTRGCQVNSGDVGGTDKTRTKSLLQKRFSSFRSRRNELNSKRGLPKGAQRGGPSKVASNAIPDVTRPLGAALLNVTQGAQLDRPSMAMNASRVPNAATTTSQISQKSLYTDQNELWASFGHQPSSASSTDQHSVMVNSGRVPASVDFDKFQELPTFVNAAERNTVTLNPIIESSFSLKSEIPFVRMNDFASSGDATSPEPRNNHVSIVAGHNAPQQADALSPQAWNSLDEPIVVVPGSDSRVDAILGEMSPEKATMLRNIAISSTMQRYEFSLKLLDLFFTEDEQAQDITNGGGILRNLDPRRVEKIKILSLYFFPLDGEESEESSWKTIIKKLNSKCRCRRFTSRQRNSILSKGNL